MTDPNFDPEKAVAGARSLQMCAGWTEWLVPLQKARMEAIKAELLVDGSPVERLRMEYRLLEQWVARPETTLAGLRSDQRPAPRAGNGAL